MASTTTFTILALLGVFCSPAVLGIPLNISSPPITNWGIWGPFQRCPPNRYVQGFQLKTEPNQYLGDDTAANALRLFCGDPFRPDTAVISSTEGQFGSWGNVYTCYPGVLNGFQLRVESDRGNGDDTATNNIRFYCSSLPNPNDYIQADGMSWGDWSTPQHCYGNQGVCGIQTQVEPYQGDGSGQDDTMLNNIRLECCDYYQDKHEKLMAQEQDELSKLFQNEETYKKGVSPTFAEMLRKTRAEKEKSGAKNFVFKN